MLPNHRVVINDEIELTGYRPPSRKQAASQLPPPSNNSRSRAEPILISSDDELQAPAAKRPKITAQAPSGSHRSTSVKRKSPGTGPREKANRRPFLIDLTSCDDIVEETPIQRPRKRIKRPNPPQNNTREIPIPVLDSDDEPMPTPESPPLSDEPESDSDYDNIHHGYMLGWTMSAMDPDENMLDMNVNQIEEAVARLSLSQADTGSICDSCRLAPVSPLEAALSSQEMNLTYQGANSFHPSLRLQKHGPIHASYSGGRSRTGLLQHHQSPIHSPSSLAGLKLSAQFQMADACHSISQSSERILLASSSPGGTMDDEEDRRFTVDPYNSRDTLAVWNNQTHWLRGHFVNSNDPGMAGGRFQRKYYDIRRAQFDPSDPNIFASTGQDGTLAIWNSDVFSNKRTQSSTAIFEGGTRSSYIAVKKWGRETYRRNSCHDIVYRQHDSSHTRSLFAAPCDNGAIFLHSYPSTCDSFDDVRCLRVAPRAFHKAGATVWGQGPTSNALFVCSETESDSHVFHGTFDFKTGQVLYHFDNHDSGEELALSPNGATLALFTAPDDGLRMQLYDVARGNGRCTTTVILPPASPQLQIDMSPEVRTASWSPDGILLAVGGNDDVAHIYDVRCLGRGPVLSLTHQTRTSRGLPLISLTPEARSEETKYSYGITVLSWTSGTCFRSPSLALMTGGGDHCIALWDLKTACKERQVLAELGGHVGVAHFGDIYKGEKPLVAGDTDGHVYIYDFIKRDSRAGDGPIE